jgi:hypothetical protein
MIASVCVVAPLVALTGCAEKNARHEDAAQTSAVSGAFSFAVPPVALTKDCGRATLDVAIQGDKVSRNESFEYAEGKLLKVSGLEPATYHLTLTLADGRSTPLYQGEADVDIEAGQVAVANVTLRQLVTPESEGGLIIGINPQSSYVAACEVYDSFRTTGQLPRFPGDESGNVDQNDGNDTAQQDEPSQNDTAQQDEPSQDDTAQQDEPSQDDTAQQDEPSQDDTAQQSKYAPRPYFCAVVVDDVVRVGYRATTPDRAKLSLYKALCKDGLDVTSQHLDAVRCVEVQEDHTISVVAR